MGRKERRNKGRILTKGGRRKRRKEGRKEGYQGRISRKDIKEGYQGRISRKDYMNKGRKHHTKKGPYEGKNYAKDCTKNYVYMNDFMKQGGKEGRKEGRPGCCPSTPRPLS